MLKLLQTLSPGVVAFLPHGSGDKSSALGRNVFMNTEIWKNIPGYESCYLVSNFGRIKSIGKKYKTRYGTDAIRKDRIFILGHTDGCGYASVSIGGTTKTLHRLIALAFLPNPNNYRCINHKNGNKIDNRLENLEWCTQSENSKHSFVIGLQDNKGENHPKAKLTNEIVLKIRSKYIPGKYGCWKLAKEFNLSLTHIKDILHRRVWSHI